MKDNWQSLKQSGYIFTENKADISAEALMPLYAHMYWATRRSIEVVTESLKHSYVCAIKKENELVACMRLITDYATFAYLCDVVVAPQHRGQGLSKWMLTEALNKPEIRDLRRWCLMTKDAHGLYRQFGFELSDTPERFMEVLRE
ncbi:GNAT family N-acetyltransferase [uncultured Acetobacterium sp.]|jgi:N-acetylglutamate synthase-like GNAT family acetyltransferase|uniref:GNAT family N-acetyltransferase n=1 Tax=uncultured Acetobacterium sp. TaxID=217139 RepID=UPI0025F301B9|nr:GNAT family N-acetyltransferase [uncultured Acetobacterium sp.]